MPAQHIYDAAPLGALIRFLNGEPRPPARFTRKLDAWEDSNAVGRLIKKEPGRDGPGRGWPASLTLHLADYGSGATIVLVVNKTFLVTSSLVFSVAELPCAGMARVVTSWEGVDELRHLAANQAAAKAWLDVHHWSNARIEIVSEQDATLAVGTMERAA
jgi:hypothetical protein